MKQELYNIVLIGSPNVGKSSIFNYLIKKNEAIVKDEDGTTVDFRSKRIGDTLIWDTPGDYNTIEIPFEFDYMVYIVENFVTQNDKKRYLYLQSKYKEKLIVVINKIDLGEEDYSFFEFYIKISIKNRINLNSLNELFNLDLTYKNEKKIWAILGRPNVGKSSLANLLYKQEINKVDSVEGTTKEFLPLEIEDNIILDTPGQRKKVVFPHYSNIFGIIVVLDSDFCKQDLRLVNIAIERKKPVIVLLNKVDLAVNKESKSTIEKLFGVEVLNISCKKKQGISRVRDLIKHLEDMFFYRIPTGVLNKWFVKEVKEYISRVKFISHIKCAPHMFFLDCVITKDKEKMLIKKIKKQFGLTNVPVSLKYNDEKEEQTK